MKINILEEFEKEFEKNKTITVEAIENRKKAKRKILSKVRLQWESVHEYVSCFAELLELELEESYKLNDRLRFNSIRTTVERVTDHKTELLMEIPIQDDMDMAQLLGQEMELTTADDTFNGFVKRLEGEKVLVEAFPNKKLSEVQINVSAKMVFKTVSYDRMMDGLQIFSGSRPPMHVNIIQILLGNIYELKRTKIPKMDISEHDFRNIPGLPSLNPS